MAVPFFAGCTTDEHRRGDSGIDNERAKDQHRTLAPRIYEGGARRAGGALPQYEFAEMRQ